MPRKRFLKAFDEARHTAPDEIQDLAFNDGETISFIYSCPAQDTPLRLPLRLIPTNIDDYPAGNGYILYTEDNNVDTKILNTLEHLQDNLNHKEVSAALKSISTSLYESITNGAAHNPVGLVDSNSEESPPFASRAVLSSLGRDIGDEDSNGMDWDMSDLDSDDGFGFTDDQRETSHTTIQSMGKTSTTGVAKLKADLLATKAAGFRVGIHGDLIHGGIVCVSIRVAKLGISSEAMRAWTISQNQYLVLTIRFKHGYRDLNQYKDDKPSDDRVEMHIALCDTYKPSLTAISKAFDQPGSEPDKASQPSTQTQPGSLEPLFIGKPLNDLLKDRFASILKFRSHGLGWFGAEKLFNETQGSMIGDVGAAFSAQKHAKEPVRKRALPQIVTSDALDEMDITNASLPLVAMQFVLRHFVRCTEFCLACHCLTEDTFEALKPYVCSKPLCLYQFLSYGFGPSIEYEIITQPYVVDLLVSMCFSQTAAHRLKDVPLGINLRVPLLPDYATSAPTPTRYRSHTAVTTPPVEVPKIEPTFHAKWDQKQRTLTPNLDTWNSKMSLKDGDWVALMANDSNIRHFRVKDIMPPHIYLIDEITSTVLFGDSSKSLSENQLPVACYAYDKDFDSLPKSYQCQAILAMLKCLPSILDLREHLLVQKKRHHQVFLHGIRSIPPAARDLLRWIIASNRSCIVQVDTVGTDDTDVEDLLAAESRVGGMADWVQFRFAQGAPDKEQRFIESVKENATNKKHPTLFAWHGSPIHNWHSIIRNGLNYDDIVNGRSSGNGVYMSSQLSTSLGYSHGAVNYTGFSGWVNSELSVTQVVSLQEVVNAPTRFVAYQPHFVVSQKEWIQTRYLFVKSKVRHSTKGVPSSSFTQDPAYLVYGSDGKPIQIPLSAISRSQCCPEEKPRKRGAELNKKSRIGDCGEAGHEDDDISDATLEEDLRWFDSDEEFWDCSASLTKPREANSDVSKQTPVKLSPPPSTGKRNREGTPYILDQGKTDFIPGSLDLSNIRFLGPPQDASPSATRALMKAYQATLQTQENTPLHELGFYLDPDRIENMYQWIVELHSFDRDLPLSKDMKKAGITSIVLEMRFTNQFPFSPPFVRVVKPRFLPFLQGGGGHVTEGGAICMELLTSSGWSVVSSIESVLLQIRLAMSEKERPARLLLTGGRKLFGKPSYDTSCYGIFDAVQAFKRACSKHGWKVPDGIDSFSS